MFSSKKELPVIIYSVLVLVCFSGCRESDVLVYKNLLVLDDSFFEYTLPAIYEPEELQELDAALHAIKVERYKFAFSILEDMLKNHPDDLYVNYYYGFNLYLLKCYQQSIGFLERVSNSNHDLKEHSDLILVLVYLKSDKTLVAESMINKILVNKEHIFYPKAFELRKIISH